MNLFLLDTNFFRAATKSPENALMRTVMSRLRSHYQLSVDEITAIRVTPFGFLECLGVIPPKPPEVTFSFEGKPPKEIYAELIDFARDFFSQQPTLGRAHLQKKHDEQQKYVVPETEALFETCVTSILEREIDLTAALSSFLAHDYFFKYRFPTETFIRMLPMLIPAFFIDVPSEAPASRFRLSKRLYEAIEGKLNSLPEYSEVSSSLKLKPWQDFLDTDIIQEITFGYPIGGKRERVIVLTFDSADVLRQRAELHRQTGLSFAKKCNSADLRSGVISKFLDHPGGYVVQCDATGDIIRVIDLQVYFDRLAEMTP